MCLIFYIPEQFSHLSRHSSFVTCHHQSHFAVCRSFLQIGELLKTDFSSWAEARGPDLSLPQLHWFCPTSMGMALAAVENVLLAGGLILIQTLFSFIFPTAPTATSFKLCGDDPGTSPFPQTSTLLLRMCSCALVLQKVPLASLSWLLMGTIPLQATNSFYNVSTNKITIKDYNTYNKKWQGREEKWQGRWGSHTLLTVSVPISALPKFLPSPLEILIQHRITSCKITPSYPQPPLLYLPHSSCKALKEFLPTGISRFTRVIDVGDFWMWILSVGFQV